MYIRLNIFEKTYIHVYINTHICINIYICIYICTKKIIFKCIKIYMNIQVNSWCSLKGSSNKYSIFGNNGASNGLGAGSGPGGLSCSVELILYMHTVMKGLFRSKPGEFIVWGVDALVNQLNNLIGINITYMFMYI
jgi:hypothetical protein